jgi:hypothetical protein
MDLRPELFVESAAQNIAATEKPAKRVYVTRADGTVAVYQINDKYQTRAWTRYIFPFTVTSIAVCPNSLGTEDLYYSGVKNNVARVYLQRRKETGNVYQDDTTSASVKSAVVSKVKTMPVIPDGGNVRKRLAQIIIRFLKSTMPVIKSYPNAEENVITGIDESGEGYSGVVRVPFPGVFDTDVQTELAHSKAGNCQILSIDSEVQG